MEKVKVYCLKCPITNEPKYVGRTGNITQRVKAHNNKARDIYTKKREWLHALRDKGFKPIVEILNEVPIAEGHYWELYYLRDFSHKGYDLVNNNSYDLGNHTSFVKGHNAISVVAIDSNYEYVAEFDSCEEGDKFISSSSMVSSAVTGRVKTAGGFVWLRRYDYDSMSKEDLIKIVNDAFDTSNRGNKETQFREGHSAWNKGQNRKLKPDKPVHQYSATSGEYIKSWTTAKEASISLGCNTEGIGQCARGKAKTAGGFVWTYIKLDSIMPIKYIGKTNDKIKNKLK